MCLRIAGLGTGFRALQFVQPPGLQPDKDREIFLVFDMRGDGDCVKGNLLHLPQDRTLAARSLDIKLGDIQESPNRVKGWRTLLFGLKRNEKYLVINASSKLHCLRLRRKYNVDKITEQLKQIGCMDEILQYEQVQSIYGAYQAVGMQSDLLTEDTILTLLFNNKYIDVSGMLKLPSLSEVEIVRNTPLLWRICHRYKFLCDKRYHVECRTIDTIEDVKQKFLDLYNAAELTEGLTADHICLTQQNKLISDKLLKETVASVVTPSRSSGDVVILSQHNASLRVGVDGGSGMVCIEDVFVHFQPQDAANVEIVFKTHSRHAAGVGTLIVVSPQISASDLRDEVSKVVGKERNSIRISVGTSKLGRRTRLSEALSAAGGRVSVTLKAKITLHVHVVRSPAPSDDDETDFSVRVYSYDLVQALKAELFRLTGAPEDSVDLYFEGRPLSEDDTFSENRIRDKDSLEARLFPNRLRLSVRMPSRRWLDLLVNDCFAFTVGHVKAFAQNLDGHETVRECELIAIVNDRVASDNETLAKTLYSRSLTLGDFTTGLCCTPKLVLVEVENLCFTSATAHRGTFAVFSSTASAWFQQFLVMFNGESLFYGKSHCSRNCEPRIMCRNDSIPITVGVDLLKLCNAWLLRLV